ncbi:MAG: thiamine phosphate synthase [bacterium]|nr:MAG: thiamine phosphate synthase [bacterium]
MDVFKGFYFITDHKLSENGIVKDVDLALQAGVRLIQFREKTRGKKEYYSELIEIKDLCIQHQAKLIINDDIDLAVKINADGVHLGQGDTPIREAKRLLGNTKIIGISAYSLTEAHKAQDQGATYLGIGHIFPTHTKVKENPPLGTSILKEFRHQLTIPIVAIGGIHINNALSVIETGVDMLCALSFSLKGGRVKENIAELTRLFNRPKGF